MSKIQRNLLKSKLHQFRLRPKIFPAILGDDNGNVKVKNRANYVYVRIPGQPSMTIFNNRVAPTLDLPVMVGYDDAEPTKFQVLSVREFSGKFNGSTGDTNLTTPSHHSTHEWFANGGGNDVVFVGNRQYLPLRPGADSTTLLTLSRGFGYLDNNWVGISGQYFDVADAIPWTGAYFGLVYVDLDGTLDMLTGTLKNISTLGINDIPKPLVGTIPIAAVRMYGGQTGIAEFKDATDLVDLRQGYLGMPSTGSSGGHIIYDEGVALPNEPRMNFTGQYVTAYDEPGTLQTVVRVDDTRWEDINRMGFSITPESSLNFDPATYTLTLAKIGTSWSYFRRGRKNIITSDKTLVLAGTPPAKGVYFIYIDSDDGTLLQSLTAWTLADTKVPVAIVLWDNTLTPKFQLIDERHTVAIDRRMHQFIHETEGTHYVSGGVPTGTVINTDSNAAICYGLSTCVVDDEDLRWTLAELIDPTGATGTYTVMYRDGVGVYDWKTSNMPYSYTTGGFIDYDNGGTLTQGLNNKFYNEYLIATNINGQARFIIMPGRESFNNQTTAVAESPYNFDWTGFPIPEVIILYQFTYQAKNGNTDTGKVKLVALPKRIIASVVVISSQGGGLDGHVIIDESGAPMTQRSNLAFAGSVAVTDDAGSNQTLVTISVTGTVPGHVIEEEGTPLTVRPTLNFIGAGVTAADNAGDNATDITIPGGGGGGVSGGRDKSMAVFSGTSAIVGSPYIEADVDNAIIRVGSQYDPLTFGNGIRIIGSDLAPYEESWMALKSIKNDATMSAQYTLTRARGVSAVPLPLEDADNVGELLWMAQHGTGTTAYTMVASIGAMVNEQQSAVNHGTKVLIYVTSKGNHTRDKSYVFEDGDLTIGGAYYGTGSSLHLAGHEIQSSGVATPRRNKLNIVGAVVSDDAGSDTTTITISGSSSGGTGDSDISFFVDGALAIVTGTQASYVIPSAGLIGKIWLYVKDAGSAGSTIVDINKNGTTLFTTQANRPTVAYNDPDNKSYGVPDITSIAEGDVITLDIDTVATGARNLTVVIQRYIPMAGAIGGSSDIDFFVDGALAITTGSSASYVITDTCSITRVWAYVENTGSAGNTKIDINKNGTTIFTTQANRPTVAYNDADKQTNSIPDIMSAIAGDVITLDIDEVATDARSLTVVLQRVVAGGANINIVDVLQIQVFS